MPAEVKEKSFDEKDLPDLFSDNFFLCDDIIAIIP